MLSDCVQMRKARMGHSILEDYERADATSVRRQQWYSDFPAGTDGVLLTPPGPDRHFVIGATRRRQLRGPVIEKTSAEPHLGARGPVLTECLLECREDFQQIVQTREPHARFTEAYASADDFALPE